MLPLPFPCRNLTNQRQYITNEEKNQEIGGKKPPPAKKSYRRGQERRGFAPCIPTPEPARHWGRGEPRARRGRREAVACRPCRCGVRRGACLLCRLPTLPLVLLLPPSPRPPSPPGKGETLGCFYARGFAPCIPTPEPARHWGRGEPRARRGRRGAVACRPCRCGVRRGGLPALSPAYAAFSLLFCPHPPDPLPGGKGETLGYFMQGASPLASPRLNPRGTGSPCRCGKLNGGLPRAALARPAQAAPCGMSRGGVG